MGDDAVVAKAAEVLSDEVARHTRVRLPIAREAEGVQIVLGEEAVLCSVMPELEAALDRLPATGAEGYKLVVEGERVVVAGADRRGVMYGVGALLRRAKMQQGSIELPAFEPISSTPKYAVRGHEMQTSPRAKNPTERWAMANFEQLVRELVLYGMNAIETLRTIPTEYADIIQIKME